MGVKSTTTLTREDAEKLFVEKFLNRPKKIAKARAKAVLMTDTELEDAIERLNDEQYGEGYTGFDNYSIVAEYDETDWRYKGKE